MCQAGGAGDFEMLGSLRVREHSTQGLSYWLAGLGRSSRRHIRGSFQRLWVVGGCRVNLEVICPDLMLSLLGLVRTHLCWSRGPFAKASETFSITSIFFLTGWIIVGILPQCNVVARVMQRQHRRDTRFILRIKHEHQLIKGVRGSTNVKGTHYWCCQWSLWSSC